MNTNNLKKYAPQARRDFMEAVAKRLNQFGIHADSNGKLTVSTPVISGSVMQIEGLSFAAGLARARAKLVQRAESLGFEQLVEQMAYTWFNRLSAIRFMELHGYLDHNLRVLSPSPSNSSSSRHGMPGSSSQGSEQPSLSMASGFRHSLPERRTGAAFEILGHAQDVATDLGLDRNHIVELKLAGNKDEELYRILLLGQCHQLHQAMPFLFEALDDETELLLPDNLTRTDSILRGLVDSIPEDDWQQVEIIGWLYQFYISEKKDQVIGSVVKSEDIPAATQLFTPNWIVKYLVQNSIGRQWLMTYPESGLKARMEYYIEPAEQEPPVVEALAAITPASIDPETLKVLDPACGSGHILVEAYDILKSIYEERGYRVRDIPKLILEKNLYGLDIDDRAAQLAGFALMMKAREDDRRIFTRDIKLNVLAIQSTLDLFAAPSDRRSGRDCRNPEHTDVNSLNHPWQLDPGNPCRGDALADLWRRLDLHKKRPRGSMESIFDDVQSNLADTVDDIEFKQLRAILALFEQAKTLGSLIQVPQEQAEYLRNLTTQLQELALQGDTMQKPAATVLLPYVQQAWLLAQKYDAVVANPPYMGSKGMNAYLKEFAKKQFPDSKSDLFAMFTSKMLNTVKHDGFIALMTPFVWMFLSSYEELRKRILNTTNITTLVRPEYHAFFETAYVPICAFVLHKSFFVGNKSGVFFDLSDFYGYEEQPKKLREAIETPSLPWRYKVENSDFRKSPGWAIAYWLSKNALNAFETLPPLSSKYEFRQGLATGSNDRFLRYWFECSLKNIAFNIKNSEEAKNSGKKWFPCHKGGESRRWYGNHYFVVNWKNDGEELKNFPGSVIRNPSYYFRNGVTWSSLTVSSLSMRYSPCGFIFESKGAVAFEKYGNNLDLLLSLSNSKVMNHFLKVLAPTMDYSQGPLGKVPLNDSCTSLVIPLTKEAVRVARDSWDSNEISWDFQSLPIISKLFTDTLQSKKDIKLSFQQWRTQNQTTIAEMKRLEEENNRLFIEAYGLQDELSPEVPEEQITLTRADQEKDIQRLISYAIGCMMGRYRLDKPGLIYAHSGNRNFDKIYHQKNVGWVSDSVTQQSNASDVGLRCANPTYAPDEDGIVPLTDQEWFKDDASSRFREFLAAAWDEDTLQQNLDFVAESLTLSSLKPKKGETSLDTVRRYLSSQFYKDHLQTYKKRPIYWLFSSGKQKAFECLVYLHRYNDSTLARMRTGYVTPLLGKYSAYADQLNQQLQDASSSEAARIKKDMLALEKKQTELRQFDDKLKHYADMRIKIDLDDGVKVNYCKFGDLLAEVKAVTGGSE